MNELDLLKIINKELDDNSLLGNDCAELDLGQSKIFITQDTLVEDVHFSLDFISPYQLGQKAVAVNISDLCASIAKPEFITISLSMPASTDEKFVKEFYRGINDACKKFGCKAAGGDLTRAEKITISICALGQQPYKIEVGRDKAKIGDLVVICGQVGGSSLGLNELLKNSKAKNVFTEAHLNPQTAFENMKDLISLKPSRICAMDTSDGLADAVFKISEASKVKLEIDGEKLPTLNGFSEKCKELCVDSKSTLLFGAEDFSLLFTIAPEFAEKLDPKKFTIIGKVTYSGKSCIKFDEEKIELDEKTIKEKTFNHFEVTKQ